MPNPYDNDDPFGLLRSVRNSLFPTLLNRPSDDVGYVDDGGGGKPPFFEPPFKAPPLEEWGRGLDAAAEAVMPNRIISSKIVGARTGTPDLSGASDLVGNYAFQRLWESYNPSKRTDEPFYGLDPGETGFDWIKALLGPNDKPSFTRHQGEGGGYLWGYVDPTWLPGFDPGRRITTITELLAPLISSGGGGGSAAEKPDVIGPKPQPRDRLPIPFDPSTYPWPLPEQPPWEPPPWV